jgi:MFS family permease
MPFLRNLIYIPRYKELDEIIVTFIIRNFAVALFALFLPVYFWTLGFGIGDIAYFFVMFFLTHIIGFALVARLAAKIGLKHSLALNVPAMIVTFYMLHSISTFNWPLEAIAIMFGLAQSAFYLPYHVEFSKFSDYRHRGRELGLSMSLSYFFAILAPILGGVIITFYGFPALFLVASVVFFVSIIPLFLSGDVFEPLEFSFSDLFSHRLRSFFTMNIGRGMRDIGLIVLWPLFVFVILGTVLSLGIISTASGVVVVIITLYIGKLVDMRKIKSLLRWSSIIEAVFWFIRGFVLTPIQMFMADFIGRTGFLMSDTTIHSVLYEKANKRKRVEMIIFTEAYLNVGRILALVLLIAVPLALMDSFVFGFALSGIGSLFFLWYSRRVNN